MYNKRLRIFGSICAALLVLLIFPRPAQAARSMTITGNKTSLANEDEITVTASVSGFTQGETIYVKGAFNKEGSSNYFGFTKKDNDWIKNSETTSNQKQIIPDLWDGTLISKSDFSDSGFVGEGDYLYKMGFYYMTGGGSLSSVNWSENLLTVHLKPPGPTPTETPTPTHTPTPAPTAILTSTPIPTTTPIKSTIQTVISPKKIPTSTPAPSIPGSSDSVSESGQVAGAQAQPTPTMAAEDSAQTAPIPLIISLLFVGIGLALLSGVLVWKKRNDLKVRLPKEN
jgi:hypothetical protein